MINVLFIGLIVQFISILGLTIFYNDRKALAISHIIMLIGLVIGLVFTVNNLYMISIAPMYYELHPKS